MWSRRFSLSFLAIEELLSRHLCLFRCGWFRLPTIKRILDKIEENTRHFSRKRTFATHVAKVLHNCRILQPMVQNSCITWGFSETNLKQSAQFLHRKRRKGTDRSNCLSIANNLKLIKLICWFYLLFIQTVFSSRQDTSWNNPTTRYSTRCWYISQSPYCL